MVRRIAGQQLETWDSIKSEEWRTLLAGNGMSINIWPEFSYRRLAQRADLPPAALQLFDDLETTNFESILEGLWHAERVLAALQRRRADVAQLYEEVRAELAATITRVHVPWDQVPASTLKQLAAELDKYDLVFTLNYDLIPYWSIMECKDETFIGDYFWSNNIFDPADTALHPGRTGLLFLHGGVHLWQDSATGKSGKWTAPRSYGSLLTSLGENYERFPDRQPLFVSEGTSAQKMRVIRRSDYLSYARNTLHDDIADTVVFGVSFGRQDEHIVSALRAGGRKRIAISVLPGTPDSNTATMSRYRAKLADQELVFFDSRTHPLGTSSLSIEKPSTATLR